ncbi:MAG TPA: ABC transporter permease [Blastocatellia bacterium]|nr:ABC transporter permease [Blastocatellia bacterium]
MKTIRAFFVRLMSLFNRERRDRELAEEIDSILEMETEKHIRSGTAPVEARRQAHAEFGSVESMKESYRDRRGLPLVEGAAQDLRQSLRMLRRSPAITAIAVLTLALGVGATTAVFSVVYSAMLQPLPFPEPERLVQLWESRIEHGWDRASFTEANFWEVRARNRTFEEIGAFIGTKANLSGAGDPRLVSVGKVSSGFFTLLGVKPIAGRGFLDGDDQPDHDNQIALLQNQFWRTQFGADREIIGKTLRLDGKPVKVVGVLPPGEPWLNAADAFIPLVYDLKASRTGFQYEVIGRIRRGVAVEAAKADLETVCRALGAEYPKQDDGMGIKIEPASGWAASAGLRRALWVLLCAVGFVLLIACINLTNLLLVRGTGRAREISLRAALGAKRGRIVRMVLGESLLLGLVGGGFGLLLAVMMVGALTRIDTGAVPRLTHAGPNMSVLVFSLSAALLASLVSGLAPALQAPYGNIVAALREGDRGQAGNRVQSRLRAVLVTVEVGLSLVLLVGAGLLIRSFDRLLHVERGFQSENRIALAVSLPQSYSNAQVKDILTRFLAGAASAPGVISAAAVNARPMVAGWNPVMGIGTTEQGDRENGDAPWVGSRFVTPGYFRTMGIPLLNGRLFDESDATFRSVVISRSIADLLWAGNDPIGRHLLLWKGQSNVEAEVIGVVGNQRERALDKDPTLTVYLPYYAAGVTPIQFVVQTSDDPMSVVPSLRSVLSRIDPDLPLSDIESLDTVVARSLGQRRFNTLLLGLFAGLALLLAMAGIYGVLSYSVARRTSEIGVRVALGARRRTVLVLIMSQGMRPVLAGVAIGLAGAFALSRLLSGMLFGVTPVDPGTYAAVAMLAIATGLAACYVPARRALRVDPTVALRCE